MPAFYNTVDTNRIPVKGLRPEVSPTAPTSPVTGLLWEDTSASPNLLKVWDGSAWAVLNVYAGTTAGSFAAGNDSRIVGAEQAANKGAAGGYASLDGSTKVPFAQLPTGTTGTTVAAGNDSRIVGAEQAANKGVASGYASLDTGTKVPIAQIPTGTSATTVALGNDSRITGAEQTANKGAANGYASLDATTKVPVAQLPTGTGATNVILGNDARLSDTRVPTDGSVTGGSAGAGVKIAAGTITDANVAAANKDGSAAVPSLRTLGTGAAQAAAGNDSRLSDTRTPTDGTVTTAKIANGAVTDVQVAAANKDGAAATPSLRTLGFGAAQALAGTTRLDQLAAPTAAVDFNGQKITGVGTPTNPSDVARLSDVQAAQAGIDNKPSARLVLTANDTLSGLAARDGVTPVAGDRILAVAQTTASQNGIYVAAAGAWARASDTITPQSFWMVEEGSNAGTQWKVNTPAPITVGTTSLTINQWGAAGTTYTGTTNRITVSGSAIDIAATYVGQGSITTLGTITTGVWNGTAIPVANGGTGSTTAAAARTALGTSRAGFAADVPAITAGTPLAITHALGTQDVGVFIRNNTTQMMVPLDWAPLTTNAVTLYSDIAFAASALRIVVLPVA